MTNKNAAQSVRRGLVLLCALAIILPGQHVARADPCPKPPPPGCKGASCRIALSACAPARGGVTPDASGASRTQGNSHPPVLSYVAACEANTAENSDFLCSAATESCPEARATRYWIFERTWQGSTGAYSPPRRRPGTSCLAPEQLAEGVNPLLALEAAVRSDWKNFRLPAASVTTQPGGETLAGARTRLRTDAPLQVDLPPRMILGHRVILSISARRYVWSFGDGDTATVPATDSGRLAEHTYHGSGGRQITLRTFYTASFTALGTDLVNVALDGEADVPGSPTTIGIREARTQLEAGPAQ